MPRRIKKCQGVIADPTLRICNLPAGHIENGQPWCLNVFSVLSVVAVKIRGEGGDGHYILNDGGLVGRFLEWCIKEQIYSIICAGFSGGGGLLGFYLPEDAVKIEAWLATNGATKDEEKTKLYT